MDNSKLFGGMFVSIVLFGTLPVLQVHGGPTARIGKFVRCATCEGRFSGVQKGSCSGSNCEFETSGVNTVACSGSNCGPPVCIGNNCGSSTCSGSNCVKGCQGPSCISSIGSSKTHVSCSGSGCSALGTLSGGGVGSSGNIEVNSVKGGGFGAKGNHVTGGCSGHHCNKGGRCSASQCGSRSGESVKGGGCSGSYCGYY